jgi:Protein of unknown function (DUF2800)
VTTHAKLSPSSAHRWLACPGSVREEARYPDEPGGPSAIDGTHSHTLLEWCLKGSGGALSMVGVKMKDHEGEFVVDRERAARVQVALDYVKQRCGPLDTVRAEQRVSPAHLLGRSDMDGTCDVQIVGPGLLEVIDYKDGMNDVSAENNPQLELYALGVMAGYKLPVNGNYPFDRVAMTIIQPKMALKGMPAISTTTVTLDEMMGKIGKFVVGAAATDKPDAPLVPGSHCKYCKHKSCATRASNVMKEIGMAFPSVAEGQAVATIGINPVEELSQQAANLEPTSMSPDKIAQILLAAPLVRQMIEAVEAEALSRLKAGQKVPGFKVVHGRGSRAWALPEDQIADRLIKMGIPKSVVFETKVLSPAKVEKVTWEKTKAGEKVQAQLSERQLKTLETEYVAKVAGKLTVAPESDSRPAVVLDASPLFQAVPQAPVAEALPSWLS